MIIDILELVHIYIQINYIFEILISECFMNRYLPIPKRERERERERGLSYPAMI